MTMTSIAQLIIGVTDLAAAFLFMYGLKRMSSPVTAPSGIFMAGLGMLVAVLASFLYVFDVSAAAKPHLLVNVALGVGALIVLAFVFASFLALLPLLVAAVSILTTFLVVLGLTYLTQVSFIVEFLIALVGLGIAIDYSLLLVTRWREERARGSRLCQPRSDPPACGNPRASDLRS